MIADKKVHKFDQRKIENLLRTEYAFITDLFSMSSLPVYNENEEDDNKDNAKTLVKKPLLVNNKTTRATSLVELQGRIDKLKSKNNATYKDKIQKKNLQNRLKKKIKQEKRMTNQKPNKVKGEKKPTIKTDADESKPMQSDVGKENKMVFSKINFAGLGKDKKKKVMKDPKKILEKVKEVKEKVQQLKQSGETEKAIVIQEKVAWKNALARAEGTKVKDDPILLKKSIKKLEQKKKSSKKKWDARLEGVKKGQDERQVKRTENIEKRKKDKKVNKLKKASKKGKVIPGY